MRTYPMHELLPRALARAARRRYPKAAFRDVPKWNVDDNEDWLVEGVQKNGRVRMFKIPAKE